VAESSPEKVLDLANRKASLGYLDADLVSPCIGKAAFVGCDTGGGLQPSEPIEKRRRNNLAARTGGGQSGGHIEGVDDDVA